MKLAHDPLYIQESVDFLNQLLPTVTVDKISSIEHLALDHAWRSWLISSSYNTVVGLDTFEHSSFSLGTTQSFGEFISRYPTRRIRVSRSDFIITQLLSKTYHRDMLYLEDGPIHTNDCIILSVPFSGNGSYHPEHLTILDQSDDLGIPVLIDGAYFGISHGIDYPLLRPCVTDFVTSLSKSISGVPFRLGIRFTKQRVEDGISIGQIGSNLFDRLNSYVSIQLLNQFSHDWVINKYRTLSEVVCQNNNFVTTNTVTLALANSQMKEFKRGDFYRVCISEEISRLSKNS